MSKTNSHQFELLRCSEVCLQTTRDCADQSEPTPKNVCNPVNSTLQSQPQGNFISICPKTLSSRAFNLLRRVLAPLLAISLTVKSLWLRLTKSPFLMLSMSWPFAISASTVRQAPWQSWPSTCLRIWPSKQGSECTSTTPKSELQHGDCVSSFTSPKMAGQSETFLRNLRREHGLGEFRGNRSARTGGRKNKIMKSSKTRVRRALRRYKKSSGVKLGLGL